MFSVGFVKCLDQLARFLVIFI